MTEGVVNLPAAIAKAKTALFDAFQADMNILSALDTEVQKQGNANACWLSGEVIPTRLFTVLAKAGIVVATVPRNPGKHLVYPNEGTCKPFTYNH